MEKRETQKIRDFSKRWNRCLEDNGLAIILTSFLCYDIPQKSPIHCLPGKDVSGICNNSQLHIKLVLGDALVCDIIIFSYNQNHVCVLVFCPVKMRTTHDVRTNNWYIKIRQK